MRACCGGVASVKADVRSVLECPQLVQTFESQQRKQQLEDDGCDCEVLVFLVVSRAVPRLPEFAAPHIGNWDGGVFLPSSQPGSSPKHVVPRQATQIRARVVLDGAEMVARRLETLPEELPEVRAGLVAVSAAQLQHRDVLTLTDHWTRGRSCIGYILRLKFVFYTILLQSVLVLGYHDERVAKEQAACCRDQYRMQHTSKHHHHAELLYSRWSGLLEDTAVGGLVLPKLQELAGMIPPVERSIGNQQ